MKVVAFCLAPAESRISPPLLCSEAKERGLGGEVFD
jgi:hypothetical protein